MKINVQLRQNQKVYRHGIKKMIRFPELGKRTRAVFGKTLPAIPEIKSLLKQMREEFGIPDIRPGEDINDYLMPGEWIDWKAVRKRVYEQLLGIPEVLPPQMAAVQRVIEFRDELPMKPEFTEPTTRKLRIDVRKLYKSFLQLHDFALKNLFLPYNEGVERFLNAAADNLVEFLRTGIAQPIPREWMTAVHTMSVYGEKVVVAMANQLADPEETVDLFRKQFASAFPLRRRGLTNTDEAIADYLRMWLEGMALQDVADEYIAGSLCGYD